MNTAKKKFWGRTPRPPFKHNSFRSYYTRNIPATKYTILHASITLCKTWTARSCPLFLTLALPPPPPPPTHFFVCLFGFFFFCCLKNLLRLKINILSSIYPEINFPAKPMMKINNLSRPKVPAPPTPSSGSNSCPLKKCCSICSLHQAFILHKE